LPRIAKAKEKPAGLSALNLASRGMSYEVRDYRKRSDARLNKRFTNVVSAHLSSRIRYASEAVMPDQDDWEFSGADDAKAEIRAAVRYFLRGATGGTRGDIVQEIISIVRQVASRLPPEQPNSLDDGLPGG
jgi:hypothetical protein